MLKNFINKWRSKVLNVSMPSPILYAIKTCSHNHNLSTQNYLKIPLSGLWRYQKLIVHLRSADATSHQSLLRVGRGPWLTKKQLCMAGVADVIRGTSTEPSVGLGFHNKNVQPPMYRVQRWGDIDRQGRPNCGKGVSFWNVSKGWVGVVMSNVCLHEKSFSNNVCDVRNWNSL